MTPSVEAIQQVGNITSPLKFFIYNSLVIGAVIVGLAGWAKLDPWLLKVMVGTLFCYFMLVTLTSYLLVLFNPKRYLYTREEWMKKEQHLTDSKAVGEKKPISGQNVTPDNA